MLAERAKAVLISVPRILEDADALLANPVRHLLTLLCEEVRMIEYQVHELDRTLARHAAKDPVTQRLLEIPGVGVITATALVGALGYIYAFRRGRQFASWLGLTPRERSIGLRRHLGSISKQGDTYLRCLLTQGARAVLIGAHRRVKMTGKSTRLQHWALQLVERLGHNKATIAVANKLARIIWAVWHRDVPFEGGLPVAAAT